MICRAKTGTGKTLAYAIPIMDRIIRFKTATQAKYRLILASLPIIENLFLIKKNYGTSYKI